MVDLIAMVLGMPRALFPQMAHQSFGGPVEGGSQMALLAAAMSVGAVAAVIGTAAAAAGGGALVILGVGMAALATPKFLRYRSPEVVSGQDRSRVT